MISTFLGWPYHYKNSLSFPASQVYIYIYFLFFLTWLTCSEARGSLSKATMMKGFAFKILTPKDISGVTCLAFHAKPPSLLVVTMCLCAATQNWTFGLEIGVGTIAFFSWGFEYDWCAPCGGAREHRKAFVVVVVDFQFRCYASKFGHVPLAQVNFQAGFY